MRSKLFNRYIWLLNALLQHKRLRFEEISNKWKNSSLSEGNPLSIRTFHLHRQAIEELFGVEILCDKSTYEYYISSLDSFKNDTARQWLVNSFSVSNMIESGYLMKDQILFEDIPGGTEYIQTIIEAMQNKVEIILQYKPFQGCKTTYRVQTYAMKVYKQRWYLIGYVNEHRAIRTLALDRIKELVFTSRTYCIPKDFDAEEYYNKAIGIYINDKLLPKEVIIRAYGVQVEYLRSLPLHSSQNEINQSNEYSDFKYWLYITPDLISELLALGETVEVIKPEELRKEIINKLNLASNRYSGKS